MAQTAQRPAPVRSRPQERPTGKSGSGARSSSFFFNGHVPRRRALVIGVSALFGFALTVVWSAQFVDRTIGDTIADALLGHPAKGTPIAGALAGLVFALVTGIAGTFTACNVAVFSALAPLTGAQATSRRGRMAAALRPLEAGSRSARSWCRRCTAWWWECSVRACRSSTRARAAAGSPGG